MFRSVPAVKIFISFFSWLILLCACQSKKVKDPLFTALEDSRTGLHFRNELKSTEQLNLFRYMYFYNGSGVGAGDFNNDGMTDLFFAANQGDNRIYLNKGNLRFEDVTAASGLPQDKGWSTGVSLVDINSDGFLDIYICKVGNFESLQSKNQLLVCGGLNNKGIPIYSDRAADYGLDFSGFSTQSVFFDYDIDGDLDMYLLNHSLHQNTNFDYRKPLLSKGSPVSGDRLYRNEGSKFADVTKEAGINSSVIGYGLGVVVSDVNLDGLPDIYVGNDFHENDYLYINQGNGRFAEEASQRLMHTSKYSMGVDAADINNDAYPELVSVDMLADDPYILKRSLGDDEYDIFHDKIRFGYNFQYSRNNLQLNRRNGFFSEAGLFAGIAATDWSWSPLFFDFDNDGLKDLFISNGIPKRMNDIDFINYISSEGMQKMIVENKMNEANMALIDKFPEIKLPNKFYRNTSGLSFEDMESEIENNLSCFSNGAAYADFDNDGDLDVVVNNIDAAVILYENNHHAGEVPSSITLSLKGPVGNTNAIGSKIILVSSGQVRTYEKFPVKGFLSSMEVPIHVGLGDSRMDSMFVVWPDNTYERLLVDTNKHRYEVEYKKGLPVFSHNWIQSFHESTSKVVTDVSAEAKLDYLHIENSFVEFDREPLIPHMLSTEGPGLTVGDVNQDGLEDIYLGSSKGYKSALFLQQSSGKFSRSQQAELEKDSTYEDVDAAFVDVNNDGHKDLVVASGGNEYYGEDKYLTPRVYLNDGKGSLIKKEDAFSNLYVNASCILPQDFNGDGFQDLFIGGRSVPWEYGEIPTSYLLINNGKGSFRDVTSSYAPQLSQVGMVTGAIWQDINQDEINDLVVSCQWGGVYGFIHSKNTWSQRVLTDKKGWWNFILPGDIDNDGDVDFIAGNLGLNSRLKASDDRPVRLYRADFDGNGKKEQVLTYYIGDKELPFTNKMELEKQLPSLKKKFLRAEDFAKSSLQEIFTAEKLESADVLLANYFSNAMLVNDGKGNFSLQALPMQAQLATYRDAVITDANDDGKPDVLLGGNFYDYNIQSGRQDADLGSMLINQGNGRFKHENLNGMAIPGQVRHIRRITVGNKESFILARNNDSTKLIQFGKGSYKSGR